jgi:hypothetical protein
MVETETTLNTGLAMEGRLTIGHHNGAFGRTGLGATGAAHRPEAGVQTTLPMQRNRLTGKLLCQG